MEYPFEPTWSGYVLYDMEEGVLAEAQSAAEMREIASYYNEPYVWDAPFEEDYTPTRVAANPPEDYELGGPKDPEQSFARTGLKRVSLDDVKNTTLEEAHSQLVKFMPAQRWLKSRKAFEEICVWRMPWTFAGNLLRQNMKTAKEWRDEKERPTETTGLSLVPAISVFTGISGSTGLPMPLPGVVGGWVLDPVTHRKIEFRDGDPELKALIEAQNETLLTQMNTFCLRATKECIRTCLMFSGGNQKGDYVVQVKQAQAQALLANPVAFMRLLVEGINQFVNQTERRIKDNYQRYVRLNVYSDIPWEILCSDDANTPGPGSWLFNDPKFGFQGEDYKGTKHVFYDYTKIPDRIVPPNYDLTFSFSGTNWAAVNKEIEGINRQKQARRVAVPVLFPDRRVHEGDKKKNPGLKMKLRQQFIKALNKNPWKNRQFLDGDVDDVRPRDDPGTWVLLAWKQVPGYYFKDVDRKVKKFVLRVHKVASEIGDVMVLADTPFQHDVAGSAVDREDAPLGLSNVIYPGHG